MKKYSLGKIIDMVFESDSISTNDITVLSDKNIDNERRKIYEKFALFIKAVGSDPDFYKKDGKYIFYEVEVPFVKFLIIQLGRLCTDDKNIVLKYMEDLDANEILSSKKAFSLMEELANAAEDILTDDEHKAMLNFFVDLLHNTPEYYLDLCKEAIDSMRVSLAPYTTMQQVNFLSTFAKDLLHDTSKLQIEYMVNTIEYVETLEDLQKHFVDNNKINQEIIERDRSLFLRIKDDSDLCELIEKRTNKKIEEIFKHVISVK